MAAEGIKKLLPTVRRKGHREVMEREDRTDRGRGMPKVRNGGSDTGSYCVPVQKYQEIEGRKGKEGVFERGRNEVGRMGCVSIKEVGANSALHL